MTETVQWYMFDLAARHQLTSLLLNGRYAGSSLSLRVQAHWLQLCLPQQSL
ncbi:hypothetical protein FQZ97_366950 [compost metagenome]